MSEERSFSQADVDRIVQDRIARDRQTRVLSEQRVYAPDSPHSFYLDAIQARLDPHRLAHPGAHSRLHRYATELAHEMKQHTAEGRRAERIIGEFCRTEDAEQHERQHERRVKEFRALGTGGGDTASAASAAAAFVAPAFLEEALAPFRGAYRTFADQCWQLPLPSYGLDLYLPYFSSASGASQQTESAGVSETDPQAGLQSSQVVTIAGQITITQQLNDRFFGGGAADAVFARQLRQQLQEKLDRFVLNQVIAAGAAVTGAASLTANSFLEVYRDVAKGRNVLTDTAGVRLRATHLFTTSDLYSYLTDIVDSSGRPMLHPHMVPGFPLSAGADTDTGTAPNWSRFTGTVLPGNVLWFTDDNIPASGSNTQLLVSAPQEAVVVCESPEPVLAVYPQTFARSLAIDVVLYEYAGCVPRYVSGTAVVTGNAYPTSSSF